MWVDLAIVLDPVGEFGKDGGCVGQDGHPGIISFQGLHEALGHTIAFGRTDRREEQGQAEGGGGFGGWLGDVGRALSDSHSTL